MLYLRMAFTVIVGLYTSRVLLQALGVEDYGIFSVVGGLAVLFSFFSNAMNQSTQRYLTVEIGRKDDWGIKRVFSAAIHCHLIISGLIVLLSETIGLWFLNTQLVIPEQRMLAANVVFQCGLVTLILGVLNLPYIACIIAYERMGYFALTSVLDACMKLGIVFLVSLSQDDHLIGYAFLLFGVAVVKFVIDRWYCHSTFEKCRYEARWEGGLQREMMSFTGWNLFKTASVIGVNQGNNFVVNILGGGAIASAAMGLANQLNAHVYNFMSNVQTAFNPQITKTCANREWTDCFDLVGNASRLSALMLLLVAVPIALNMDFVLGLWLSEVPNDTASLSMMCLCSCFLDALTGPINTALLAYGEISRYQLVTSLLWWLALPLAIVMMLAGWPLASILLAKVISQILVLGYGLALMRRLFAYPIVSYLGQTLLPIVALAVGTMLVVGYGVDALGLCDGWLRLGVSVMLSTSSLGVYFYLAMRRQLFAERS